MPMALLGPSGRLTLEAPVYTLGSEPGNQVVLNDPRVSPRHAVLQFQGQQYSITDLGSTDGTYLNEQRLGPHMPAFLKNGDKLRIGNTFYTFEESLPAAAAYAPTMMASSAPAYNPTIQAPQAPVAPAYGQSNPAFPPYGQVPQAPAAPAYGQSNPAFPPYGQPPQPPVTPVYGQESQVPGAPAYGQSSPAFPTYPQGNVSAPGYPAYPAPASADPYGAPTAAYAPAPGQPYPPQQPWAAGMPPGYTPPAAPKKKKTLMIVLISLLVVLVLGGSGVAYGVYVATRPKPVITVTSDYSVGTTPAGATTTVFHLSGSSFTANSDVTFLLDSTAVPGSQAAHSDSNGKVTTALTVTNDWTVGNHKITAKDAAGYVTALGVSVTIVTPGQSKTPGPSGAPTDTANLMITATVSAGSDSAGVALTVTGGTDSGTVCSDVANGKPRSHKGTSNGLSYTETLVSTCSGTYKSGRLTYTEMMTSDQIVFTDGVICTVQTPFVYHHMEGSFTSSSDINGTYSSNATSLTCKLGGQSQTTNIPAQTGSWTGVASVQ